MVDVLVADLLRGTEPHLGWLCQNALGSLGHDFCCGVDGGGAVLCSPLVTGSEIASKSPVVWSY